MTPLMMAASLVTATFSLACGSSQEWVAAVPGPGAAEERDLVANRADGAPTPSSRSSGMAPDHWTQQEPPERRPRITEVVTLGETDLPTRADRLRRLRPVPHGPIPPTVQVVNVDNRASQRATVLGGWSPAPFAYDGYWSGRAAPAEPSCRQNSRSAPRQIGDDWGSLPSYGPNFPFSSAPADPWSR